MSSDIIGQEIKPLEPTGILFDLMRFSTRDGPGIRATVFFKGCPLNCLWCHNPESQRPRPELMLRPNLCIGCQACLAVCPQHGITCQDGQIHTDLSACVLCGACAEICLAEARQVVGRTESVEEVMAEIRSDAPFYEQSGGGVTFSGGEPLLQSAFLLRLLQTCRAEEIHTAVDTCGYAPRHSFAKILPYVNLFLFDLKAIDDSLHRQVTGVSNALILDNLRFLVEQSALVRVRIPVIPGINDHPENFEAISQFLAHLPSPPQVELLPYHESGVEKYLRLGRSYPLKDIRPPSTEAMQTIIQFFANHNLISLNTHTSGGVS
jgi:pyruvate formate lyase activating enzyme